ncbi:hypothetical protein [Kribbella speibonae]|uniref:Uncharacterized protein n=1 Tax=Kribbella speibonae TaxID=1572660 RepID=A0ABY1ZZL9_9ACTN|nr:hypothetical protein [Kribbella speibonae]TCC20094.1 hypothetical protein E0H58_28600 [Kribbella speibonae]
MAAEQVQQRAARFLSGWVLVSAESGRLLENPDELAVELGTVRKDGNGTYTISGGAETFRLIKRAGPVRSGVRLEYSVDLDDVPTVELTLSDRLAPDEVAPALARALAESAAVIRGGEPSEYRVFGPASTPDVDAVQRPADAAHCAELRQRGRLERTLPSDPAGDARRAAVRKRIRALALTMGVADGQPNAELLRTLLTAEERAILDRAADPDARPLEDRVDQRGYLAKALGGSGVSAAVIGTAAAVFTGNPLVGFGIAVPTIVNAAVGSFAERRLDKQKMAGRKPAYTAERKQREYEFPGLRALLDGAEPVRPAAVKMPRATAWRNYLRRYAVPTLATAAVAGALTTFGVPALSTALVIATSALAKSLAERLVDTKKLEFRLRRIDATERIRLSDPTLYVNQLATEINELRTRFDRALGALRTGAAAPGDARLAADVPGAPPFTVSLAAQLIENVSGTARRAFVGGRRTPGAEPTPLARHVGPEMQGLLAAAGPGLLGALTGAMGDKYFLNRDEPARDASKMWSRKHQEAAQSAALAGSVEPRLRAFRELADRLEEAAGLPADLSTRAADRGLPTVTAPPAVPRPPARAPLSAYAVQAAAGSLGGLAGAVGLDALLDLPDLAVVLTAAGAAGSMTATPTARYLFRRRELGVHEALETDKAVRAVNQNELLEQRAITRYLMTQLAMQTEAITNHPAPPSTAIDQAVRRLAAEPPGKPLLPERLIALEQLAQAEAAATHHETHGTPDSRTHVHQHLNQTREKINTLWQQAGAPSPLTITPPDELNRLRHLLSNPTTPAQRMESTSRTPAPNVSANPRAHDSRDR